MTTPDDERARLRALAERTKAAPSGNEFAEAYAAFRRTANPDAVLRLLDDVERAERERDGLRTMVIARESWQQSFNAERARAERLEAALRKAGDYLRPDFGVGTPAVHAALATIVSALAEPAPGGQDAERVVNAEGPPGSYGCKCTSRNALECARQAYYAGVEARERCGCLCHQWTDSGPWRCLTGDGR